MQRFLIGDSLYQEIMSSPGKKNREKKNKMAMTVFDVTPHGSWG